MLHFPLPLPLLFLIVRGTLFTVCKIFTLHHLIMNPHILKIFWKKSTALLIISLLGSLLQELNCWVVSQVPFQKETFVTVNILRAFHFPNWVSKQINSVKWYFNAIIIITNNSISYDGLSISNCAAGNYVVLVVSSLARLPKHLTIVIRI